MGALFIRIGVKFHIRKYIRSLESLFDSSNRLSFMYSNIDSNMISNLVRLRDGHRMITG